MERPPLTLGEWCEKRRLRGVDLLVETSENRCAASRQRDNVATLVSLIAETLDESLTLEVVED